eukprot:13507635-Alexandrium_andersonii.AAC.1
MAALRSRKPSSRPQPPHLTSSAQRRCSQWRSRSSSRTPSHGRPIGHQHGSSQTRTGALGG